MCLWCCRFERDVRKLAEVLDDDFPVLRTSSTMRELMDLEESITVDGVQLHIDAVSTALESKSDVAVERTQVESSSSRHHTLMNIHGDTFNWKNETIVREVFSGTDFSDLKDGPDAGCSIEKTEHKAISLNQLSLVAIHIKRRLASETWMVQRYTASGRAMLELTDVEQVNL